MKKINIFMGDITHDTITLVSDTIPINIGFIASYAKKMFKDDIQISLFKFPKSIISEMRSNPPDILALSNYSWNSHLSEYICSIAKEINPNVITIQGGTNFPHEKNQQLTFSNMRRNTDFFVELEGEVSFSNFLKRYISIGNKNIFKDKIDGCVFLDPKSTMNKPYLVKGEKPERLKTLDEIPSPYLNGMLDNFFDGRLTPFIETNRGCPFKCSFCHTGNDYFQKINMFSTDRVKDEIDYIAKKISGVGVSNLHIADTNFGMYPRDREVTLALSESNKKYKWPLHIMSTTGKNNKHRVIEITDILGSTFSVNMSVQSMDDNVLKNINRSNISLEDYKGVNEHLSRKGRSGNGEVIIGLPGENKNTFLLGLEKLLDAGVTNITIYTLMLLHGTEFQDPEYRKKYKIMGKFRIVPLNFSSLNGKKIIDYEEVGIQTKDMSFKDYIEIRGISVLVEILHNARPFEEFFYLTSSLGYKRIYVIKKIYDEIFKTAPKKIQIIMKDYLKETKKELWDSEKQLVEFYNIEKNYKKLLNGELGGNLIYKYKAINISNAKDEWVSFFGKIILNLAKKKFKEKKIISKINQQIKEISIFCNNKLEGLLNPKGNIQPLYFDSNYDIPGWLKSETKSLDNFYSKNKINYKFRYSPQQKRSQKNLYKRYGTDFNALSKIVTRVGNVESLVREIWTKKGRENIYTDVKGDRNIRYHLSG